MKTFIITLLDSTLSTSLAADCIIQANKHNVNPYIWPAVNGAIYGERKFSEHQIKPFMIQHLNVPGVIGCFLSHYELWLKCIELDETILVLEHDGFLLSQLPDNINDMFQDVLYLDPFKPTEPDYNSLVENNVVACDSVFSPEANGSSFAGEFLTGAYGYCIKPAAAKALVDFSKNIGALPADVIIGRDIVDIKCTTANFLRLHPFYNQTTIHSNSSTANLSKFLAN